MSRVGVDTNVVVSFLTDRDPDQQARAAELFGAATSGDLVIVLHDAVITEVIDVMCNVYETRPATVRAAMRDVLSLPGVMTAGQLEWPAAWELWPRRIGDFADACLTAAAKAGAFDLLATFDVKLSRRAKRHGVGAYEIQSARRPRRSLRNPAT